MNKRKQKKIFLGFSILAFLISSATAIWTIWNAKDNKKFSEYDKLIEELKKEKNLVLSPEHKKKAEDFLNNPRYKNSSKENIEIIKKVINEIKNQNSKEKDKIKDLISKVKLTSKKTKLEKDLLNAKNSNDKQKIMDYAIKLTDIELAIDSNLERIEAKELIKKIKDTNKKKYLENKLVSIKNLNDLDSLISDIERELLKQGVNDYISAKRNALKTKIAASKLDADEKTNLSKLINDSKTISSLFENEVNVNFEIAKSGLKKEIKDKIDRLKDNDFKKSVQNSLNKAKNIKDYYDILNKINEHEFNNKKADAIKSLDDLSDQNKKNDFIRELNNLTFAKPNANDELNRIINEINKLKHRQIDFIIDEVKKLPYPNGMDSIAVKDLTKKLDDIKSDDALSNLEKFNKANEIIGKNLDTYKSKINDAKDKISKLSPESAKKANEQLNQTSLLVADVKLPNHSFDELDESLKDLFNIDKQSAKNKINTIAGAKLNNQEKSKFINLIDDPKVDDWSKILDIIDKVKIAVGKKDLEDQAKVLNYPLGENSNAVKSLIKQINSNGADKIDTIQKVESFRQKLSELSGKINDARKLISKLSKSKQTELNNELNDANDLDKLNLLIKKANDVFKTEQIKALKSELDSIVNNLPYPAIDAPAKKEIKDSYKDINEFEKLNEIKEKITNQINGIEAKINKAKTNINNLPINKQSDLNNLLNSANTDDEFDALDTKIKDAESSFKNENKDFIEKLSDLTKEQKDLLKDQIDKALTADEIQRIKDKAELLNKIEVLKKVITPDDYALANNQEVKKIIDETISNLKKSIDGIEKDKVIDKKNELDALKDKLTELKTEVEKLSNNDVLELEKTRVELAKKLAKATDDEDINNTKLYIQKAKLKKKASELEYPNGKDSVAIRELNNRINDATQDNVKSLEDLVSKLPKNIDEAKKLIAEVNKNANDEDQKRRKHLNDQLSRSIDEDDFTELKENINKAKNQSAEDYKKDLKNRLKEQVERLDYPKPDAKAKEDLKSKIDTLNDQMLETFGQTIDQIANKIAEAKERISKLSEKNKETANDETSKVSEVARFDDLFKKLDELKSNDKSEINKKIDELNELLDDEKTTYKNEVNGADSYSDMLEILEKARNKYLEKLVDKLPYPSNNGRGKNILKANVISANNANDSTFKNQKDALEKVKQAIIKAKERIKNLPYSKDDTPGRRLLNQKLDEATIESEINDLAKDDLKEKIQKYKDLIDKNTDYKIPDSYKSNLKNGRLDHLPNTNENELKKQIYETKRLRSAFPVIERLNNLTIEKINQLKNDIPVWNDNTDNNLTLEKFVEKVNNIDAKILEAVKEDLKAKVESIPYPNGTSKEAQDAKKALKDKIQKLTSKAQTDAEYIKLDNLITKINELKQDALSIVNEAEKVAIEKLIDALDNESKVPNIKLAILKAKAKDKIDAISDLSQTEKTNLKTKITNAQNNAEIDKVVDEAKKIAIFNQRKKLIKTLIDQIPYPKQNPTIVANSIKTLKEQVDALKDDETMILKLENKINDLKAVVHTLVEKAEKINFIKGDSQKPTDALNKIKEKIDGLIEISKGSEIIPDDYDNKISKYKDIINKSFKDNNIKNIFLTKLNKAVPDNYDGSNYKLSNLDVELLAKLKELAIAKIDNMNNLDEIKKKAHKAKINGINSPSDLNAYQVNVIDAIDNFIVEAYKENYKIFIDKLAYPLDAENAAKSLSTKAKLKDKYVSNITKSTNINELEQNLNNFKKKVDDVKEIIASISDTIEQNKIAIKNFNKQFSGFNQEKQLDNLKKLVDNYIKISKKFNEFSPYVGTPSDDLAAANKSLGALKAKLWEELAKIDSKALQDQLVGVINANIELYKNSKMLFSGDILVVTNFLDESLDLLNKKKDKTTVADINAIIAKMQPYKTELDKFWTQNKGDWLRADIRKNKWFTSIPDNIINPVDPDKYRFVTYELLLKKLRTRKTPTEVKRIVDVEVEQYKALFEFRQAYENSNSANIPAKVKDSLKHKILNVSTDATKVQMDQITKYLGQRITTGNNVTSGFYLDAKFLLDSIIQSNVGGKASNQSHYQKLFDVIGDPTPGHNNNDDVTEKIDNFRTQITKFIEKLKEAKNKVTEFKTKYGNDPKVSDFEAKLDKVVVILSTANDQGAQDLINEINNYISQLNTQKDDIKRLIMSLPYSNPSSTDAQKSKSILNKKVDNAKTKQELDDLNSEINALNTKMNEFINSLSSIPYDANKLKTAIETIKRALDKATTIQDVENILPDNWGQRISEYKTIINDSYLDQAPINNLLTRLNQTVPSTLRDNEPFPTGDYKENQLIDEILHEFKQESISTINQLSNLKTRQKTQFDNITKRVNDINPKNYQWNSIESAIMLIKQQTNDAIKLNYDLFIDNNLAYPSKSNLSSLVSETKKRIKMHLTSNVTRKTKADVERKLNELKTKIDMVKTKISKVKNIVQTSNKKDEFERELAQTDDQNIDNLIAKIDKYNHAITLLEQIKNDTDKINLKGNLSSASTLDQINDVIRDINVKISEINNAKLRAQNAINSIPDKYNTHKHSKNLKQEYTKQLMNKDNLSLDVLNKLIADAELEKYRFETQDWIDAKLDKYNNKGLNLYNKLNHNDQTPTRDSVDQIRKEVEAELEHIKKDITDRVRTELFDNATALYRRIDRNDKRHVYAEQSYYEWFKEEIKKQPSEMKVNELEYKFITERYAESVRIRAFLVSFQYNIEHSNEFNANQELRSNILNEIKKYATEYQTNDSRDDKFDGFTIYDFWRTFNLHLRDLEINRKLPANIKTVIRKLFSLSGQVEAPDANITTTQSEISNKVDKSIISKVLQKIKGNSIQNSQYTASEAYMIINVLFVKTISNKSGNTYDKILRLKSDNVFANIISGNGSKGLIQGAELWNSNLQKENS